MKKTLMLTSALVLLAGGPAFAQDLVDRIATDFQSNGFQNVEIKSRAGQIKAEGIREGQKYEVTYDKSTGGIVKQEWEPADRSEDRTAMSSGSLDGTATTDDRGRREGVDDSGDDVNDDHGGDRAGNDDRGDEAGDDHGRGGHGSDDSGRDDRGGDDSGRDGRGGNDDSGGRHGGDDDSGDDHGDD